MLQIKLKARTEIEDGFHNKYLGIKKQHTIQNEHNYFK